MNVAARAGQPVWESLRACPPLSRHTLARDELWLVVRAFVCTKGVREVTPHGSAAHVLITNEHACDELLAAMSWLHAHEGQARLLDPAELFLTLRTVATRGADGSGRRSQADALHGMTGVPSGQGVRWQPLDGSGAA